MEKRRLTTERRRLETGYYDHTPQNIRQRQQRHRRVFLWVGGLLLVCSFIGLILSLREVLKIREGGQWPQTAADISSTRVVYRSSRSSSYYVVVGRYEYSVNGAQYLREADLPGRYRNHREAEQIAPTYAGQIGTIWYDPFEPARSQNTPITAALAIGVLAVTAGALLFGLALIYQGLGIAASPDLS